MDDGQLVYDHNPHLTARRSARYPCPHELCDGSGYVFDEQLNAARPCACREQRNDRVRAQHAEPSTKRGVRKAILRHTAIRDISLPVDRKDGLLVHSLEQIAKTVHDDLMGDDEHAIPGVVPAELFDVISA
mgnify:CR=1 FL=1